MEGKYTVERVAREKGITRQSAINYLSKLKKASQVQVSGGGRQKRIYTISSLPKKPTNGFFDIVNAYSEDKLVPEFEHYTYGNYTVEHAIIDGLSYDSLRIRQALMHLFRHVHNWKLLFDIARHKDQVNELKHAYLEARKHVKVRKMPTRYL